MKKLLKYTSLYNLFNLIIGASKARRILLNDYIKSNDNARILDLGCGTCSILPNLDFMEYTGIDISDEYIESNKRRFSKYSDVLFIASDINDFLENNDSQYDIVLLLGVMHHLNDEDLGLLLRNIRKAISPDGRLVTFDGCIEEQTPRFTRWILNNDRGNYVRTKAAWLDVFLSSDAFSDYTYSIRRDLLCIPYNHIIFHRREK